MGQRLCIFCEEFPCMKKDAEVSVVTELVGEYQFRLEDDSYKPCNGTKFRSVFEGLVPEAPLEAAAPAKLEVFKEKPQTYKRAIVLKASNSETLQIQLDKIIEDASVYDYSVHGPATAYDADSCKTSMLVVLDVEFLKEVEAPDGKGT